MIATVRRNVVGVIAIEASGSDPLSNAVRTSLTFDPPLAEDFAAVESNGCNLQPEGSISTLTNYTFPVTLVGTPNSFLAASLPCSLASLQQAGVDASLVMMQDVGAPGTGHFLVAETNNADSAQAIIDIAAGMAAGE